MTRVFSIAVFLFAGATWAEDGCVKVTQTTSESGLELWAQLNQCLEATVTVSAEELVNVENALPATVNSNGARRFLVARWRQVEPKTRWKVKQWRYQWKLGRPLEHVPSSTGPWRLPFDGERELLQGPRGTFSHGAGTQDEEANDWAMLEDTPVLAARDGVVVGFRDDCTAGGVDESFRFEANYVVLKHRDGTYSEYYHLKPAGVSVRLGARVKAGTEIGRSGNTGYSSQPHLHFAVFVPLDGTSRVTLPVEFESR